MNPEEHINLVNYMTRRLYPKYKERINHEDFYQVLSLGLVTACRKFNPELGYAFATFACRVMEVHILKHLREDGLAVSKVHDKYKFQNINTFTEVFSKNENGEKLDYVEDLSSKNDSFKEFEDRFDLKNALNKLSELHRDVIIQQFINNKTQTEIAKKYGVTQVEISRRKNKALQQLRTLLSA